MQSDESSVSIRSAKQSRSQFVMVFRLFDRNRPFLLSSLGALGSEEPGGSERTRE